MVDSESSISLTVGLEVALRLISLILLLILEAILRLPFQHFGDKLCKKTTHLNLTEVKNKQTNISLGEIVP